VRILICLLLSFSALAPAQKRIVSTAPAITETLFALGLGDRVVGVSTYCHFPKEAAALPKIGTYLQPNVEAILRLRPDLVIMERLAPAALDKLHNAGIHVKQIATGDVSTNLRMIEDIADGAGISARGKALSAEIAKSLRDVEHATAALPKRKVVFVVGRTPGRLEGIIAVGKGSYLNELIQKAGGENVLSNSLVTYPKVSLEAMIRMQPDVIIDMGDMAETTGVTDAHKKAVIDLWRTRKDIRASIHAVASDIFVVPGPRMVDAAREFRQLIHGDAKP
jgi:iron complex transport system substrate-binding protein